MKALGGVQQEILLFLLAGASFYFTRTPKRYHRISDCSGKEWKNLGKVRMERSVAGMCRSKMIDLKLQPDGTWKMVLTDHGKRRALYYKIESMEVKRPKRWDKKWRVVLFDIPEKRKSDRDAFRKWIKKLGFSELQKSVFVLPYDCRDEFDFVVEFLGLRKYVRFIVTDDIDNDTYLKNRFFQR
ncbi:MAG: CRISPR-associated endonuclease Cas2 [Candidatus Moraniibacteriota bacterium]